MIKKPAFLFAVLLFSFYMQARSKNGIVEMTDCFLADCSGLATQGQVQFGYLTVPENHSKPNGRSLKLAFAVLKSQSKTPLPDPVIYLSGGPGGKSLDRIHTWTDHHLRKTRDFILVDFRGIGYSEPRICPELNEQVFSLFAANLSPEAEKEQKSQLLFGCFEQMKAAGLDLNQYHSAAVVRDLEQLRTALGYEAWNLYGISYGTRVALTYLRDYPSPVRSAILDSSVPVGTDLLTEHTETYRKSLREFFSLCKSDPACNERFPDLEARFYEAVEALRTDPILLRSANYPDRYFYANIYKTGSESPLLMLFGLPEAAHSLFYLSYLVLGGAVFSLLHLLRGWPYFSKTWFKVLNVFNVLILTSICFIIFKYDLFPI